MLRVTDEKTDKVVIYHDPCPDGFTAAWVARIALGNQVAFEGKNYNAPFDLAQLPLYTGKEVFILDFSLPADMLRQLATVAKSVVICDHHKTFAEHMEKWGGVEITNEGFFLMDKKIFVLFDAAKSGAQLAWKYFFPNEAEPPLITYIADRDLWTWKQPDSRAVSAALHVWPRTFDSWSLISLEIESDLATVVGRGRSILEFQRVQVDSVARKAFKISLRAHTDIPCVNTSVMQSEVCERMLELNPAAPFVAAFFFLDAKTKIWSLRSRATEKFDVSALCKSFGGGGHFNAAGFTENL